MFQHEKPNFQVWWQVKCSKALVSPFLTSETMVSLRTICQVPPIHHFVAPWPWKHLLLHHNNTTNNILLNNNSHESPMILQSGGSPTLQVDLSQTDEPSTWSTTPSTARPPRPVAVAMIPMGAPVQVGPPTPEMQEWHRVLEVSPVGWLVSWLRFVGWLNLMRLVGWT